MLKNSKFSTDTKSCIVLDDANTFVADLYLLCTIYGKITSNIVLFNQGETLKIPATHYRRGFTNQRAGIMRRTDKCDNRYRSGSSLHPQRGVV